MKTIFLRRCNRTARPHTHQARRTYGAALRMEQLEERALLAIAAPVGSSLSRFDVNRDGIISPLDAIQVINQLTRNGVQQLRGTTARAASASAPTTEDPLARFDVNGDGLISSLDAIGIINQLHQPQQLATTVLAVRLEVTDLLGTPITQISQGGDFLLKVYIKDLRDVGSQGGVFSAHLDVTFDPALANVNGGPTFAAPYDQTTFDSSTPGLLDEAGGIDGLTPLGTAERLLFSIPMRATAGGTITFASDPADEEGHEMILYGRDDAVLPDEVAFGSVTLEVLPLPAISISNVSQAEGNSGLTPFQFQVTLSAPSDTPVTVNFATQADTATADVDYQSSSGTITFNPGVTSQTITVNIIGDTINEPNERFFVVLSDASPNATIAVGQAEGIIVNDDGPPSLSINNASLPEGNSGTTPFQFTVTLSGISGLPVTVNFATAAGTATVGVDFTPTSGQLTFNPGESTKTIVVNVIGDALQEANETFFVNLSGAVNAEIAQPQGVGTILNDDAGPEITIDDPAPLVEPATGTRDMLFTVRLSTASELPVSVQFATQANTAGANDFVSTSGTLTFNPGETVKTIPVAIKADSLAESDETFFVILSGAVNGSISRGQGVGTIRDLVLDKAARVRFAFTDLNGEPIQQIHGANPFYLNVYVQDLREEAGGVFQAFLDAVFDPNFLEADPSTLLFEDPYTDGQTWQVDNALGVIDEVGGLDGIVPLGPSERLLFRIQVRGLAAGTATVTGNAADDQGHEFLLYGRDEPLAEQEIQFLSGSIEILPPSLITVQSVSTPEGNSGTKNLVFTVNLARQDDRTVTVNFATTAGTATAGVDYQNVSGTLTFAPGVTSQTISVPIFGDLLNEPDETLFLNLFGATNAVIAPGSAQVTGTILNDDPLPTITVNDVAVTEGLGNASFTVRLSAPSAQTVVVNFATGGGTATASADYVPVSGTLTFQPGQTEKTITVQVLRDNLDEGSEQFFLNFSGVQNATLARNRAIGTINDIALGSISGYVYGDVNKNGVFDGNDVGLANVTIRLVGTNIFGESINVQQQTATGGGYRFDRLLPGTYRVIEVHPSVLMDGPENLGNAGGFISGNDEFTITLGLGVDAANYNFGEYGLLSVFLSQDLFFASSLNGRN
jgi:hypothetical protein